MKTRRVGILHSGVKECWQSSQMYVCRFLLNITSDDAHLGQTRFSSPMAVPLFRMSDFHTFSQYCTCAGSLLVSSAKADERQQFPLEERFPPTIIRSLSVLQRVGQAGVDPVK